MSDFNIDFKIRCNCSECVKLTHQEENIDWLEKQTKGKPINVEQLQKITLGIVTIKDRLMGNIIELNRLIDSNNKIIKGCFINQEKENSDVQLVLEKEL